MAAKKKSRKLFQVAKELKLATPTLSEELVKLGYKVTKAQMTPITDEMYGRLLQKFAPEHWANLQDKAAREEVERQEAAAQKARQDDLQKILEADSPMDTAKKPAPSVRNVHPEDLIRSQKTSEKPLANTVETEKAVPEEKPVAQEEAKETPKPQKHKKPEPKVTPSVRGAAEHVPPPKPEKPKVEKKEKTQESKPAAQQGKPSRSEGKPSRPDKKFKKPGKKKVDSPAVRGGVSNNDILPASPVAEGAKKPVKGKQTPSPQDHASGSDEDSASKKRKRKRKTSRKKQEQTEQPQRGGKSGGWVSTGDAGGSKSKRRRKRDKKKKPDAAEVQASIKQTMAAMEEKTKKKRKRRVQQVGMVDEDSSLLKITEYISTQELASLMDVPVTDLIKECLMLGLRVTINQRLEKDTIQLLAEEHEYHVEFVDELEQQTILTESEETEIEVEEGELEPRAPIVTVMGHVDHGKTSLLDYIRKTKVTEGEAGGITQHIGAYEIEHGESKITFLDTPGHEAFTAMRARGAQVTDVVVLVVAADDQVMPQTLEAIDHAKAANVPMVIAINKMDKPGANSEKVRQQLADKEILVEEWGGEVQSAEVSAKTGMGIDDLLDKIILATEMLELKAVKNTTARGFIIESRQEKGRGTVCTVLIQRGTLKVGNVFVAGPHYGRVRAMFDEIGKHPEEIGPGQPVLITGFEGTPHVGDQLIVFKEEREAKEIANKRQQQLREQEMRMTEGAGRGDLLQLVEGSEVRELSLVIKGDVDGSVEAIADSLMRLSTDEVSVKIIRRGVGPINESDILLASASHAMVLGFNVHPMGKAREMALLQNVPFETYRIIYELIENVKDIIIGMHRIDIKEEIVGAAEVRDTFKISRIGTIAGCYVVEGKIERHNRIRVLRDGKEVYVGDLDTLKRFKDDTKEVQQGYECGMKVANFNDIKVGDILQAFKMVEVERHIEVG